MHSGTTPASHPFYDALRRAVRAYGGMFNAHLHLDRAGTLVDQYQSPAAGAASPALVNSHVSLPKKHSLIHDLHAGPAYAAEDLRTRVNTCLRTMLNCDTSRADTLVDVTADQVGLNALRVLREIKAERAHQIDLRLGAYSPFGFRDDQPEAWECFAVGAREADFIGALPEADDLRDYPGHIGFREHCRRTVRLARELDVDLHVHTDQRNEPGESGTEDLIEVLEELSQSDTELLEWCRSADRIWVVHAISPATYPEERFERLTAGLLKFNVGVICCPSAALGMRQLRSIAGPTYNSIPRVLEWLAAGVGLRLGSDNIADICSPSTTADLSDEVFVLSAALRFYHPDILARLACGQRPDEAQRALIREHLAENAAAIARSVERGKRSAEASG